MNLRNRVVQTSNFHKKKNAEQTSTSNSHNTIVEKENDDKVKPQDEAIRKDDKKEKVTKELTQKEELNKYVLEENSSFEDVGKKHFGLRRELFFPKKISSPSSFEVEIAKVKISLPFNEILMNSEYISQIGRMLKAEDFLDIVNLQDDRATIMYGPRVEISEEDYVLPFYISLRIHSLFLHNTMLDSGASHNLMP